MTSLEKKENDHLLTLESFKNFLQTENEKTKEKVEILKGIAEIFLCALKEPIQQREKYFTEIFSAARDYQISVEEIRIMLDTALELKHARNSLRKRMLELLDVIENKSYSNK